MYDATVAATLSGSASVTPLGNDIVSVSTTPVGTFADKNVGTGKSVSIGALSLTGTDAGNYTPVAPAALTADITPFQLSLGGVDRQQQGLRRDGQCHAQRHARRRTSSRATASR